MSSEYNEVRSIFEDILDDEAHISNIDIKDSVSKKEYIKRVYEFITTNEFVGMREDTITYLELSRTTFDDFMIEIICSNLYCDLAIIYQTICGKKTQHEYFLGRLGVYETENKRTIERFRKRLQPNRLNATKLLPLPGDDYKYYVPTVLKAYKDTLFVKRTGTNVFDISEIFIDIFSALFFDSDQQAADKSFISNCQNIKAYRLWDFTADTIDVVSWMYSSALKNKKNHYRFAEFIFLEKLFGLKTINAVLSCNSDSKELLQIVDAISPLIAFGYNGFTEMIIHSINMTNHAIYGNIIREYILPLGLRCIQIILNDFIDYIARIATEKRKPLLENFLNICLAFAKPTEEKLSFKPNKTNANKSFRLFRRLFDIPTDKNNSNSVREYITSTNGFFKNASYNENKPTDKSFVFDRGYTDLTFRTRQVKNLILDEDIEDISEEFIKNQRVLY